MKADNEFKSEIKALDTVYSEMVEAILNKPDTGDYEISRIYFENITAQMNKWTAIINSIKTSLEERIPIGDLSADNRPA